MKQSFFALIFALAYLTTLIDAHGFLFDPAARSTVWRYDSKYKPYYNDMEMFCGGITTQWQQNGGKCSICGESYTASPKLFEKGGSYYIGENVRSYRKGQMITVSTDVWTNHLGWFEYRICNVDGWATDATQECLDKTILKDANGKSRFLVGGTEGERRTVTHLLVLPSTLTCNHCVFQWKWHTGNRHGTDPVTGEYCYGCGPVQEEFYGCADVAILNF